MKTKAMKVFEELVRKAAERRAFFTDDTTMNFCRIKGEDFPEKLKPGRMVFGLNEEERKALSELTSEEVARLVRI